MPPIQTTPLDIPYETKHKINFLERINKSIKKGPSDFFAATTTEFYFAELVRQACEHPELPSPEECRKLAKNAAEKAKKAILSTETFGRGVIRTYFETYDTNMFIDETGPESIVRTAIDVYNNIYNQRRL